MRTCWRRCLTLPHSELGVKFYNIKCKRIQFHLLLENNSRHEFMSFEIMTMGQTIISHCYDRECVNVFTREWSRVKFHICQFATSPKCVLCRSFVIYNWPIYKLTINYFAQAVISSSFLSFQTVKGKNMKFSYRMMRTSALTIIIVQTMKKVV